MATITTLYAWVAMDESGKHGILGFGTQHGVMQCVSSNLAYLLEMKPEIEKGAKMIGHQIWLRKFSVVEDIEKIEP